MAGWQDAFLGKLYKNGLPLELRGVLNFVGFSITPYNDAQGKPLGWTLQTSGDGGGGGATTTATYLTVDDQTADLPASRWLTAGSNVTLTPVAGPARLRVDATPHTLAQTMAVGNATGAPALVVNSALGSSIVGDASTTLAISSPDITDDHSAAAGVVIDGASIVVDESNTWAGAFISVGGAGRDESHAPNIGGALLLASGSAPGGVGGATITLVGAGATGGTVEIVAGGAAGNAVVDTVAGAFIVKTAGVERFRVAADGTVTGLKSRFTVNFGSTSAAGSTTALSPTLGNGRGAFNTLDDVGCYWIAPAACTVIAMRADHGTPMTTANVAYTVRKAVAFAAFADQSMGVSVAATAHSAATASAPVTLAAGDRVCIKGVQSAVESNANEGALITLLVEM